MSCAVSFSKFTCCEIQYCHVHDTGSKVDMEQATDVNWCSCLPLRKESQIKRYEDDRLELTNALDFPCHHPDSCSM